MTPFGTLRRLGRVNDAPTCERPLDRSARFFQNHGADCPPRGETPLSGAGAPWRQGDGPDCAGVRERGRRGDGCSGFAMLSVPTLWTVFVINFLAVGLIWAYVMQSYPKFEAAPFWTGSAFAAAAGAALATLRFATGWDSLLPLLAGGTVLIFAACLATMGVKRFYGRPVSWRDTALITGLSCAGLAFFIFGYDSMKMRILIYSVGQSLPLALTLKLLLSRQNGRANPGGRLAAIVAIIIIAIYALRAGASLLQLGGEISFVRFSPGQSALILMLVFLSMAWNFGFLLMAIDRLRNEVADLALLDR